MKKIISFLLALLLGITALAGCGQTQSERSTGEPSAEPQGWQPPADSPYTYSDSEIRAGKQVIRPIQTILWRETADKEAPDGKRFEDLGGAYKILNDPATDVADFPRITTSEALTLIQPQGTEQNTPPSIYDMQFREVYFYGICWETLHTLTPGEYVVTFTQRKEYRPNSRGVYEVCCYQNIFVLVVEAAEITSSCVKQEGDEYFVVLPISGVELRVRDTEVPRLAWLDDELLRAAEEKIRKDMAKYTDSPYFYLETDREGYLCLASEEIVYFDGSEDEADSGGCGDHKHVFASERIMK